MFHILNFSHNSAGKEEEDEEDSHMKIFTQILVLL